jgi:hypothetical protein
MLHVGETGKEEEEDHLGYSLCLTHFLLLY